MGLIHLHYEVQYSTYPFNTDRELAQPSADAGASSAKGEAMPGALIPPRLDFGNARPRVERVGDIDADPIGGVWREVDGALDQVVATDRAQRDPVGAVPTLHSKVGHAIEGEGLGV